MRIKLNGEKVDTSPDNTILFQFAGDLAMYNFVYIDGEESYAKVWEQSSNGDLYKRLAKLAIDEKYPVHQNLRALLEEDRVDYEAMALKDIRKMDTVPIAWQKEH